MRRGAVRISGSTNNGADAELNNVRPAFTNASISDLFKPTDRLTSMLASASKTSRTTFCQTDTPGNELLVNNYNASHCISGLTVTSRVLWARLPGRLHADRAHSVSPARLDYAHIFSPRFGATYQFDPNTIVRASYGRFHPAGGNIGGRFNVHSGNDAQHAVLRELRLQRPMRDRSSPRFRTTPTFRWNALDSPSRRAGFAFAFLPSNEQ